MNKIDYYIPENVPPDLMETAHIKNEMDIPIIASVIITQEIWGRLDIIMLRYYSRLDVLPIILDFNNIMDITELKVNDIINLPNIALLNTNTTFNPLLEEYEVPGFHEHGYDNMTKLQHAIATQSYQKKTKTPTKTTANPKLKVTVNRVKVDIPNGILTF